MKAPIPLAVDELLEGFGISAEHVLRADLSRDDSVWLETEDAAQHAWFHRQKKLERAFPEEDKAIPLCDSFPFQDKNAKILAWRPGRRIALRIENKDGFEVIKGLRPKKLYSAHRCYQLVERALGGRDDFLVPEVSLVPEWNALRLTGLAMQPLTVSNDEVQMFHAVGAALARFQHRVPVRDLPLRGFESELSVLGDLAQRHLRGMGTLPDGWDEQRRRLHASGHHDQFGPVACHRDLHDGQLLNDGKRVALLDFDLLASASPLLDLGNLIAHLHLRVLQDSSLGSDVAESCERSLLAGFGFLHEAKLLDELTAYKTSSFLRLALVYSMRPRWRSLTAPLIQFAKHCLDDPQLI